MSTGVRCNEKTSLAELNRLVTKPDQGTCRCGFTVNKDFPKPG